MRGLVAGSTEAGAGLLTGALDATLYDGPWVLAEDLEQYKFHVSYAFDVGAARVRLTAQGYDGQWAASDQIPLRAVRSGLVDALGYIDPDLGGSTDRYAFTASADFSEWSLTAYVIDYELSLYSNFTYYLDDPYLGDEFEQRDQRTVYGFLAGGSRDASLASWPVTLRWGLEGRIDDIAEVGLYQTAARRRHAIVRSDRVEESSVGAYIEVETPLTRRLRAILGLRGDYYHWDVNAFRPENGGDGDDSLGAPKLSLAYRFGRGLEGYANWARGFHSNDVRGATISVDPLSGARAEAVPVLVDSAGAELGLRFERGRRFNATLAAFYLELDSELVFVGDAGATEANDGTERRGVEVSSFWQATEWLALDATYTYTHAAFEKDQGGGDEIPGAVASTFALGLNAIWANGWSGSARVRYLGEAPLVEDDSVRAPGSVLINVGLAHRRGPLEVRLDVFNLLDTDDYDISYYYGSRLPGEGPEGVEDIHFHPLEPRTVRGTITWHL